MKKIGILYDKGSKKVFLLPEHVKLLIDKGITVNVLSGAGEVLGIRDTTYVQAGATICKKWKDVIANSDVLLKTNAFSKSELKHMEKKIAITMASYLNNVDMLYNMLKHKVTGLEWIGLADRNGYVLFPKIEAVKSAFVFKQLNQALSTGLSKKEKDYVIYPKNPKILILNATFGGVALAKTTAHEGFEVTIADNDEKYLKELKATAGLKSIKCVDANYETLLKQFKEKCIFVNTTISPTELTKSRITEQMIQLLMKGGMAVDMSCEFGYGFQFIKHYTKDEAKWIELDKRYYLAPTDITDLCAKQVSAIISRESVDYLIDVAQKGVDNTNIWKITNCQNGKVVNAAINDKLKLY